MSIRADAKPASSSVQAHFQDEKFPPQVHPDGRVTFRLKAPLAQKVQIEPINGQPENNGFNGLGKAPYDMVKDILSAVSFFTLFQCSGFSFFLLTTVFCILHY